MVKYQLFYAHNLRILVCYQCLHQGILPFHKKKDISVPSRISLGVFIFNNGHSFSLNGHCETVLDKVSKNTNLLKLCRPYLTTHSAKQFYFQFIHCYLIYGIHIYYNLCASNITNPIFTQQKRALRIVANVQHIPFYLSPTNDLCTSLKILPLPILSNYFTCITGFKALNN